jgi:hypothetical protein
MRLKLFSYKHPSDPEYSTIQIAADGAFEAITELKNIQDFIRSCDRERGPTSENYRLKEEEITKRYELAMSILEISASLAVYSVTEETWKKFKQDGSELLEKLRSEEGAE